jgi:hypothetical protein
MLCVLTNRCTQVLLATLCMLPLQAKAQPEQRQYVALDYQVDPRSDGCPGEGEFRARLISRLGYDPHKPDADREVEVFTRPTDSGLEGVIRWTNQSDTAGPRVINSPTSDCAQLSATMAFVLAVQIQLMASEAEEPGEGAPSDGSRAARGDGTAQRERAVPKPARSQGAPESTPRDSTKPHEEPDTISVSGGGGPSVGVGLAPEPVLQGRLFLGARLGWAALELGMEARPAQTAIFAGGIGFRHKMLAGSLAACSQHGQLGLCAVSRLGLLEVSGVGIDRPSSANAVLVQIGPRVAYLVPLSERVGLSGHLDGNYLLSPSVVRIDGAAVWSVPRFSTVAGIDLTIHFH